MDNYKIIPYQPIHGTEIIRSGMNDPLMDLDASYYENRIDIAAPGFSFTLMSAEQPIVAGGIFPLWQGCAEGWVLSSQKIFKHKIRAAVHIKKRMDMLCINNQIWRLQTSVKANFKLGIRFAKWLGLEEEGLMKQYGPDKTNYYRMAKIYKI